MRTKLIAAAYTSLILYLGAMFFFGAAGHFAYQSLKIQAAALEQNVQSLEAAGRKLRYSVTALRQDPQSIVKAGRRLLLLREREGIIRVAGSRERPKPLSPGGLVSVNKEAGIRFEPFLRAFALIGGLLVFLFSKQRGKDRRR